MALTLSNSFCVDRFRGEFIDLMRSGYVNAVFANTDEILSLYETPDFNEALDNLRAEGVLGFVTRSEKGCIIVDGDQTWKIPASPIAKLKDRPARATCSPPASWPASRAGAIWSLADASACWPRRRSFSIWARGPTCRLAELAKENDIAV